MNSFPQRWRYSGTVQLYTFSQFIYHLWRCRQICWMLSETSHQHWSMGSILILQDSYEKLWQIICSLLVEPHCSFEDAFCGIIELISCCWCSLCPRTSFCSLMEFLVCHLKKVDLVLDEVGSWVPVLCSLSSCLSVWLRSYTGNSNLQGESQQS